MKNHLTMAGSNVKVNLQPSRVSATSSPARLPGFDQEDNCEPVKVLLLCSFSELRDMDRIPLSALLLLILRLSCTATHSVMGPTSTLKSPLPAPLAVFHERSEAHMVLRAKRANSFLEEIKAPSKERECVEEICDFEEAREIFQTREATLEFWTVYTDGNQCEPDPCINGTCIDQFQAFVCKCNLGFDGRLCDQRSTASNCLTNNGDCDHICKDSVDGLSRTCSCLPGYNLRDNLRTCTPAVPYACGQQHVNRSMESKVYKTLRPWLVGGQVGKKGESPWQALILNEKGVFHCGGVLISESWVLTAAHCLETNTRVSVRLGDYQRAKFEGTEVTVMVSEAFIHPDYNTHTVDNDIALLRLASPVPFKEFIAPVCLPSHQLAEQILHRNGTKTIITGWGKVDEQKNQFTSALNVIEVPLADHNFCSHVMHDRVSENMLCAGKLGSRRDACTGDSGGPMVTFYRGTWFLIGLVSWGDGCGHPEKLGIYTKVSNYLEWIKSIQNRSKKL
ncbi:vitamin K-dependent protein C [Arapaima gigas]